MADQVVGIPPATLDRLERSGLVAGGRLTPAGVEASLAFLTQWGRRGGRDEPEPESGPDGRGGRI